MHMDRKKYEPDLAQVFDEIAPNWYNRFHWTRFKTELGALACRWQKGHLLNLGCGHGADFLPFKDKFKLYGIDFSHGMLEQADRYAEKFDFSPELTAGNIRNLPYDENTFDWAIAVAAFHHMKGPAEICDAFRELFRVLKPGGEAFITMWNRWQPGFWFKPKELFVPWRSGSRVLKRYYYLASYAQTERFAKKAGFTIIASFPEASYRFPVKHFSKNICLLVKKP